MSESVESLLGEVRNNEERGRYELGTEQLMAILEYVREEVPAKKEGGEMVRVVRFTHTFVPMGLRGGVVSSRLVEAGLNDAARRGEKVVPECWFVAKFLKKRPEFNGLVFEREG